MNDTEKMLKELGRKTMFNVSDAEMPALLEEYNVFMSHVQALKLLILRGLNRLLFIMKLKQHS